MEVCTFFIRFLHPLMFFFFFFNDTATTEIYTLSLTTLFRSRFPRIRTSRPTSSGSPPNLPSPVSGSRSTTGRTRSEEHTSELQSRLHLVCRLLLEKKK